MAPERLDPPDWTALEQAYPAALVEGLRDTLEHADASVIDPTLLGPSFNTDIATTIRLLEEVARLGLLATEEVKLCGNCGIVAAAEDQAAGTCPNPGCGKRYEELDTPFRTKRVFKLPEGRQSRDISWLVTAHGMNTDGPWQQDFSWLIANKLRYSAPVLILKYPVFRVMALFARTQRLMVGDLGERLETAIAYAKQRDELRDAPDVVLHSYGTLLFSRLLLDENFDGLKFGRVILAGSIVPPDYDWGQHIRAGRIEQVVSHCGDKDGVVLLAQYFIPNSGPSGRIGFTDKAVRNVRATDYGHGTFFDIEPMRANLAPGGIWDRFLTYPPENLEGDDQMTGPATWSPNPLAVVTRFATKLLALLGLGPLLWFGMQLWSAIKTLLYARQ